MTQSLPQPDDADPMCAASRFVLTEADQIPVGGRLLADVSITTATHVRDVRQHLAAILTELGASGTVIADIQLAASEAGTNAYIHGRGGRCCIYAQDDRVVIRVSDRGTGIDPSCIEQAVFVPGFSTAGTCGMGYTLMLELADRVWLATSREGTVVQLEKRIRA